MHAWSLAVVCVLTGLGAVRAGAAPAGDAPAAANEAQGITGRVVKLVGNFMPGPGLPQGGQQPLAVPVHVFKGRVKMFAAPDRAHPALVRVVQADADGRFRCALPPGEYTAVAEIDGRLYLNLEISDGANTYWATVTVESGTWASFVIQDTSQAAF